jgi:hypothetical protein
LWPVELGVNRRYGDKVRRGCPLSAPQGAVLAGFFRSVAAVRIRGMRSISRAIVLALVCGAMASAQQPTPQGPELTPAQTFKKIITALDAEAIGIEGLAFDQDATEIMFADFDHRIAQWQEVITQDQAQIAKLQADGDSGTNQAAIQQLQARVDLARGQIDVLTRLKNVVKADPQCGFGQKLDQLNGLIKLIGSQLAQMAPAIEQMKRLQSMPSLPGIPGIGSASVSLQTSFDRYESLMKSLETQRDIINESCESAKHDATIEQGTRAAGDAVVRAMQVAVGGHINDVGTLAKILLPVVEVARQDAFGLGLDQPKDEQEHFMGELVRIVDAYAERVVQNCQKESGGLENLLAIQRTTQQIGVEGGLSSKVDLNPCLYRMYEVDAVMDVPFQLRHCGDINLWGDWGFRLAPGTEWKLNGGLNVDQGGSGHLDVSGTGKSTMGTYAVWFKGPATVTVREDRLGKIKLMSIANMELQLQRSAIPAGGGVMHPARSATGTYPVQMLGQKACDPTQDVWKFDPGSVLR